MYICIEGNIGAGKSTLAKALAERLKAAFLPERFEENTLLPLFYEDKKTFAFPTEYAFLIDRQKQLAQHFAKKPKLTVADYFLDKCLYFAEINLSGKDFKFYKKHFAAVRSTVPQPDLIIYINAPEELLLRNIRKRGRDYEQQIGEKYLKKISRVYHRNLLKKDPSRVYVMNISAYNKDTIANGVKDICTFIGEKMPAATKTAKGNKQH